VPAYLPFVLGGVVAIGLIAWSIARQRRRDRAQSTLLERLGFHACPEKKAWLEETVARLENNPRYRYEVKHPKRLGRDTPIYHYVVMCHRQFDEDPVVSEEILFQLKRPSSAGLVVAVKPSVLAPGLATRMLGAIATGPWDTQPDDLQRIDLPRELANTNLLSAMGPPGANLYDLVDARVVSAMQGVGDAGGLLVSFRDDWCAVSSGDQQTPFRVDLVIASFRPLL
jgi:hypothetical protein